MGRLVRGAETAGHDLVEIVFVFAHDADRDARRRRSGRDLFEGEMGDIGTFPGVLDGDATDVSIAIEIQDRVLVQVFGLGNLDRTEFDIEGVGILKVLDSHGTNGLSKNALCYIRSRVA